MVDILTDEEISEMIGIIEDDSLPAYNTICEIRGIYREAMDDIENFLYSKCHLWRRGDTSSIPTNEIIKYIFIKLNGANVKSKKLFSNFIEQETEDINGYLRIKGKSEDGVTTKDLYEILHNTVNKNKEKQTINYLPDIKIVPEENNESSDVRYSPFDIQMGVFKYVTEDFLIDIENYATENKIRYLGDVSLVTKDEAKKFMRDRLDKLYKQLSNSINGYFDDDVEVIDEQGHMKVKDQYEKLHNFVESDEE